MRTLKTLVLICAIMVAGCANTRTHVEPVKDMVVKVPSEVGRLVPIKMANPRFYFKLANSYQEDFQSNVVACLKERLQEKGGVIVEQEAQADYILNCAGGMIQEHSSMQPGFTATDGMFWGARLSQGIPIVGQSVALVTGTLSIADFIIGKSKEVREVSADFGVVFQRGVEGWGRGGNVRAIQSHLRKKEAMPVIVQAMTDHIMRGVVFPGDPEVREEQPEVVTL